MNDDFDWVGCLIHVVALVGVGLVLIAILAIGQVVHDHVRWIP